MVHVQVAEGRQEARCVWGFLILIFGVVEHGRPEPHLKCRGRNLRRIILELCIPRGARRRRGGRGSTVQAVHSAFGTGQVELLRLWYRELFEKLYSTEKPRF